MLRKHKANMLRKQTANFTETDTLNRVIEPRPRKPAFRIIYPTLTDLTVFDTNKFTGRTLIIYLFTPIHLLENTTRYWLHIFWSTQKRNLFLRIRIGLRKMYLRVPKSTPYNDMDTNKTLQTLNISLLFRAISSGNCYW